MDSGEHSARPQRHSRSGPARQDAPGPAVLDFYRLHGEKRTTPRPMAAGRQRLQHRVQQRLATRTANIVRKPTQRRAGSGNR